MSNSRETNFTKSKDDLPTPGGGTQTRPTFTADNCFAFCFLGKYISDWIWNFISKKGT